MNHNNSPTRTRLVFFGATGDLAHKKIFPALQAMVKRGTLNGTRYRCGQGRLEPGPPQSPGQGQPGEPRRIGSGGIRQTVRLAEIRGRRLQRSGDVSSPLPATRLRASARPFTWPSRPPRLARLSSNSPEPVAPATPGSSSKSRSAATCPQRGLSIKSCSKPSTRRRSFA